MIGYGQDDEAIRQAFTEARRRMGDPTPVSVPAPGHAEPFCEQSGVRVSQCVGCREEARGGRA